MEHYDFSGWATRNDMLCADGRVIRKNAFRSCDGQTVPLVWNHQHNDPDNILGHALLENRDDGVYAYCSLNDTRQGQAMKKVVQHGDVRSLSIFANQLKQSGMDVLHGAIREVSLVLAGANPGAFIDSVIAHGSDTEEGIILGYDENIMLYHSEEEPKVEKELKKKPESEETVSDVFETLSEKQKNVVYALIGQALKEKDAAENDTDTEDDEEEKAVKHSIFDRSETPENTLSHSEIEAVFADVKRYGTLRDSALAHGIEQIDYLFPDAKNITGTPQFVQRDMGWVHKVMNSVHRTPFSRIKSILADITEDEARAKGYIKGKKKKDEVFSLLKRTTAPTTVYKHQKLDRDDVVDITDFDVVGWLKSEMRMMLDEEIARAILLGDGRLSSSDDKIKEDCIRPIWKDDELYSIKATIDTTDASTPDQRAKAFIRAMIKARKDYKGSGEPTLFTSEDVLTDCLLLEDATGRIIYDSVAKLATTLRVKEIVTVPVMEGQSRTVDGAKLGLMGIIVNLNDYNVGADKGGAVNLFDDFDIDYNAQKYLIETRCSGALIKPYSAIVIEEKQASGSGASGTV